MAELATVARPYAEAAFKIATEQNALPVWGEMLKLASSIMGNRATNDTFSNFPKLLVHTRINLSHSPSPSLLGGSTFKFITDNGAPASSFESGGCSRMYLGSPVAM